MGFDSNGVLSARTHAASGAGSGMAAPAIKCSFKMSAGVTVVYNFRPGTHLTVLFRVCIACNQHVHCFYNKGYIQCAVGGKA